jgi:hypothetical protein
LAPLALVAAGATGSGLVGAWDCVATTAQGAQSQWSLVVKQDAGKLSATVRSVDGITLEAVGEVVLTAGNPEIADSRAPSYPAVVNHVIYFGDGVSRKTVCGGSGLPAPTTSGSGRSRLSVRRDPEDAVLLLTAAIRSMRGYPTIENVEVYDNYTSPCGAGVSVEHLGQTQDSARFRNCVFRNNRTQTTGSAVDLLHGSGPRLKTAYSWQRRQPGLTTSASDRREYHQSMAGRADGSRVSCNGQQAV